MPNLQRTAKYTSTLPPWHPDRKVLRVYEVPAYLKRLYNITVGRHAIDRWIRDGVRSKKTGRTIRLVAPVIHNCHMVAKADLWEFIKQWP